MVREYTNREVGRIMGDGEEGRMKLIPLVSFSRDQIRVRFQICREKSFPVKDLVTFSQAVEFERFLEYGKGRGVPPPGASGPGAGGRIQGVLCPV